MASLISTGRKASGGRKDGREGPSMGHAVSKLPQFFLEVEDGPRIISMGVGVDPVLGYLGGR